MWPTSFGRERLITRPVALKSIRAFFSLSAVVLVFGYVVLILTAPRNYITTDPSSDSLGWAKMQTSISVRKIESPQFAEPALRMEAADDDARLALRSRDMPPGPIVFSVYLRADERTTLKINLLSDVSAGALVRVTPQWKRFFITAKSGGGKVDVNLGDSESFSRGEVVEIFGPQLETGEVAGDYVSSNVQDSSWFNVISHRQGLRSEQRLLLALGIAMFMCWLLSFRRTRMRFANTWVRASNLVRDAYDSHRRSLNTALAYIGIFFATLVVMEFAAFIASTAIATRSSSIELAIKLVWRRALSSAFGTTQADPTAGTVFSPLTQIVRVPGGTAQQLHSFGPYIVNRLGLIDNEGASDVLDVMPEKPPGMIRIILYGGSTAMGIGARNGTETLSSQLERMLNRRAKPGTMFQVLNFGHGASMSYSDLQFMISMGAYLDPDVSILLNGFNDAYFATESSFNTQSYPYVSNWTDFSYYFNNSVNGLYPRGRATISFLPFTSMLVGDLLADDAKSAARTFYQALPARVVSEWVDKRHSSRDILLMQNLRFTAGYFINRREVLLSFLQPHPLEFRKLLTAGPPDRPAEESMVNLWIERGTPLLPEEYRRRMLAMFGAYAERYKQLQIEYAQYPNIKFYDIRDALEDLPVPAYQDIIHYTPAAQKHLAARMFSYFLDIDVVESRLKKRRGSP
jgi:hypothetical protein